MSLDEIAAAVEQDKVLLPASGANIRSNDPRYHEPASDGSLKAACNRTTKDMQAVDRSFARTRFEPCQVCGGGER